MAWVYILLAGACETAWPLGFKYTNGFRQNLPAAFATFAVMCLSFWLMSKSIQHGLHVGTAYALWTGIGAAGTAALGITLFNEPKTPLRLFCLSLIILAVIGLKFAAPSTPTTTPSQTAQYSAD